MKNKVIFILSFVISLVLWILVFLFPKYNFWMWYLPFSFLFYIFYLFVWGEEGYFEEMRLLGVWSTLLLVLAVKWIFKL